MSQSPARVIALVQPPPRQRPDASWPLADYIRWWLEIGAAGRTDSTIEAYDYALRHVLSRIGDVSLSELTTIDLQTVMVQIRNDGKAENSVYLTHNAVSAALGDAVKRYGILDRNVARGVVVRRAPPPDRTILTHAQSMRILDYMTSVKGALPSYAVIGVMIQTGARIMEAAGLRMVDINLDGDAPTVRIRCQADYVKRSKTWIRREPKSKRGNRILPLPTEAAALIEARLARHPRTPTGDDWALGTTLDRPCSPTAITSALESVCVATGIVPIKPHTCRTSYLTNLARAGVDMATLEYLAGDEQRTVMRHYLKTDAETVASSVAKLFPSLRTDAGLTT